MRFLVVLLLALAASRVEAETILVAGDSIAVRVVPALQAALPSDVVIDAGMNGDTSDNLARFATAVAIRPDRVVLEYGTNDAVLAAPPLTPAQSWRNLRRMARLARSAGAIVYALVPPPSVCKYPDICGSATSSAAIANRHTRALATLMLASRLPPRMTVLNLRDQWHEAPGGWWGNSDILGSHPYGDGLTRMAGWIADAINADRR